MKDPHADVSRDDGPGRLIRLTAPPQISADRFAAAKAGARAHWQDDLRRRGRRRNWTLAALAAAAVIVVGLSLRLAYGPAGTAGTIVARVETVRGDARIAVAGEETTTPLHPGQPLALHASLVTGAAGGIAVRTGGGASLRIDGGTQLSLESPTTIFIEHGAAYFDAREEAGELVVVTPFGSVTDVGTQFEVRVAADAMRVRVREGRVVLGEEHGGESIGAGAEATVGPRGLTRGTIDPQDPGWDWAEALARTPDIEGRTAEAFLAWVARELGLELAWDGETTLRKARETILHGSVRHLTPGEALEAVLPTAGLGHRTDGDRLVVGPYDGRD